MLKRPFAVIGFSMLMTFLAITNITHKMTIALLAGAVVIFSCFLFFKSLRKYLSVIFVLFGVITFAISFVCAEKYYLNEMNNFEKEQIIQGVVCETPKESDYAFTYIVKVEGERYKVRFVTQNNKFLSEGDYVSLTVLNGDDKNDAEMIKHSLSSRIYFTFFESDKCIIENTGKVNVYYKYAGMAKRVFSEIVMKYLPGENGAIAKAMTIGDESQLDTQVVRWFNYCGTSHLLVVSGLHLTLWSFGIMKILIKSSKLRKISPAIGILCIFLYASITGFGVSVLRAGAMVMAVLMGKFLKRDADSINSIGVAVFLILIVNPFAPFSVSLWFTVLSTLGILAYSDKIKEWIEEKTKNKRVSKIPLFIDLVVSVAISFSTTVFTLPVFIFNYNIIPAASILSNFIMVNVALVLMVLTVLGVISHLLFLYPLAKICFLITGVLSEILYFFAEKIGMSKWSTVSLNHIYYKYFLVLLIIGVIVVVVAREYDFDIIKPMTVTLSVLFILTTLYCTGYDYNTTSVEIATTDEKPILVINSKGRSVLIGTSHQKITDITEEMLSRHNKKTLDVIFVTEEDENTVLEIVSLYNNFGESEVYFCSETSEYSNESLNINLENTDCIRITSNGQQILVANSEKIENLFENIKECDIIIAYGENAMKYEKSLNDVKVIAIDDYKTTSVYFK